MPRRTSRSAGAAAAWHAAPCWTRYTWAAATRDLSDVLEAAALEHGSTRGEPMAA